MEITPSPILRGAGGGSAGGTPGKLFDWVAAHAPGTPPASPMP